MDAYNTPINLPLSFTNYTATTSNFLASSSSTSIPTCPTNPWMDSRIWSKLPQRLVDRVIAFLPPPAFFRARLVCKRWYSLLFSNSFLELYLQISPRRQHWFLFFKHKTLGSYISRNNTNNDNLYDEGYLFDPYEFMWYRLSFALVPSGFTPASSSGGLICWVSDEAGPKTLLLSNPLVLGSLAQFPPTLRPRLFPTIGLTISAMSIDLVVAGDDLISPFAVKNLTTESFHIDGGGFYSIWGTTSSLPRLCSLESGRMVYVDRKFYCMNYSPFSVLVYDPMENTWSKIQAPMRRFLRSPSLVECRGKLILIAAVEKSKLNVPKSLRLWGLQGCGTMWVEVERMPQQLYMQFSEAEGGRGFDCVGHGEFVIVTIRGRPDKGVMFDFQGKRWQWIPPCPYVCHEKELHGFAYDPKLATPVTALLHQFSSLPFQAFNP
ncbi:F-box domain [Dillenia turbinata]|uniref:F-box domain n=1 Tax=Dillenia turbinata TaxID=194707 RepID=A0AAN8UUD7_9MAGN